MKLELIAAKVVIGEFDPNKVIKGCCLKCNRVLSKINTAQ